MYLQSVKIENFRKFGVLNNVVEFVTPYTNKAYKEKDIKNSVSSATTLIVGKNNVGKTTITAALQQAISDEKVSGNKFNNIYLKKIFEMHLGKSDFEDKTPKMTFAFTIGLDVDPDVFAVNNISDFISVDELEKDKKSAVIEVRYEVKEESEYSKAVQISIENWRKKGLTEAQMFREYISLLSNKIDFTKKLYNSNQDEVSGTNIKLIDIIDLKIINANLDDGNRTLSTTFNKIVKYRLNSTDQSVNKDIIDDKIYSINSDITNMIGSQHDETVNSVVSKVTDESKMKVHLQSNLTYASMFNSLINYEFMENGYFIPENQFGLGYKNLMRIIGQLIDYMEQYDNDDVHHKINLICVEEPENYMHPQMQELFIKNIDDAISVLMDKTKKNINSQLILTTHSSHILNSKIHTSGTFNNINYISSGEDKCSNVIRLSDSRIANTGATGDEKRGKGLITADELTFLKKHIKFKVSDLFFSDAVILVEGITEEQLLNHYISERSGLAKYYISVFNINGAFAHIYKSLLDLLNVPCLAITDLDIKRSSQEKGVKTKEQPDACYLQIESLEGRQTTNAVLRKYICGVTEEDAVETDDEDEKSANIPSILNYYRESDNAGFKVVYQKNKIESYFASSFEEAFILTNYKNTILNKTLKDVKPGIYKAIVGKVGEEEYTNSIHKSYEWQQKLSSSKSDFANTLLYNIYSMAEDKPALPDYIEDGLVWLESNLG
ncbi:AAA family ATPase [Shewanella marina]|uniref:AAA family ATPase n=1 Tax=Shewanella marina TaxID=487319 RepID=UPI000472E654|nr:AAA family ATPase [Shewanella marina]